MEFGSPHAPMSATFSNGSGSSQSSLAPPKQPISSANAYLEAATISSGFESTSTIAGPSTTPGIQRALSNGHRRSASGGVNATILSAMAPPGSASTRSAGEASRALLDTYKHTIAEAESYLNVFDARARLEEDYIRGLKSISDKARDGVLRLDGRSMSSELPGVRLAWRDMLQSQMREMDARTRYAETLRQGVIAPLLTYRDAQERIRKRVKEDIKTSIAAHDEMRNHTLPRAKKTYDKRCEELENVRLQQQAIEDQRTLLSPPNAPHDSPSIHSSRGGGAFSPTSSGSPSEHEDDRRSEPGTAATSPGRASSVREKRVARRGGSNGSDPSHQYHGSEGTSPRIGADGSVPSSPPLGSGNNGFAGHDGKKGHFLDALRSRENWEAARKEAPKKLNALISRMREGTNASGDRSADHAGGSAGGAGVFSMSPDSGNGGTSMGLPLGSGPGSMRSTQNIALRHVKAKREAEEADQIYRKAVFDLETLRLRREKTLLAARTSVLEARRELHTTCQAIWTQAEKSAQSLANANLGSSVHAEEVLRHSLDNLDDELEMLNARLPVVDEEKVRYVNYHMGECKDLIFGVSLVDYAFSRAQQTAPQLGPGKAEAPLIVRKCIAFIEERALDQPGIYRTSAKHTAIQNLAHALERDEERFDFSASDDESATVAGVLKLYLRQLPDPILPMPIEERVRYTHERQEHIQTGFASLKGRIRRLPAVNQATLRTIVEHLAKIASHAEQNKMTASNLSIIFGPLLLSQADHETTSLAAAMEEDRVTEDLITYADAIFDLSHAGAPVLPPVPTSKGSGDSTWDNLAATASGPGIARASLPTPPLPLPPLSRQTTTGSGADLQSTLEAFPVPQQHGAQYAESVHGDRIASTRTAMERFSLDDASSTHSAAHMPLGITTAVPEAPASTLLSAQQPHISALPSTAADDDHSIFTASEDDAGTTATSADGGAATAAAFASSAGGGGEDSADDTLKTPTVSSIKSDSTPRAD